MPLNQLFNYIHSTEFYKKACVTQSRTLDQPAASLPKRQTLKLGSMPGKSVPGTNKLQELYQKPVQWDSEVSSSEADLASTPKIQNYSLAALCNPTCNQWIFLSFAVRILGSQSVPGARLPRVSRWMGLDQGDRLLGTMAKGSPCLGALRDAGSKKLAGKHDQQCEYQYNSIFLQCNCGYMHFLVLSELCMCYLILKA